MITDPLFYASGVKNMNIMFSFFCWTGAVFILCEWVFCFHTASLQRAFKMGRGCSPLNSWGAVGLQLGFGVLSVTWLLPATSPPPCRPAELFVQHAGCLQTVLSFTVLIHISTILFYFDLSCVLSKDFLVARRTRWLLALYLQNISFTPYWGTCANRFMPLPPP